MWYVEREFSVKLGGNTYIDTPNLIVHKGIPLFRIRQDPLTGILHVDCTVFDSTGKRVATFAKGIVVQGDKDNFIITTGDEEYTIKEKSSGRVLVRVRRRGVGGAQLEVSVQLYTSNGFLVDATPTHTNVAGLAMTGCVMRNSDAGISIN